MSDAMSEISEEQAREAAKQIPGFVLMELSKEVREVLMWATCELSRRDAERAERAKPITAKWCLANGATRNRYGVLEFAAEYNTVGVSFGKKYVAVGVNGASVLCLSDGSLRESISQRQLLDLLKALRGGT